MHLAKVLGIEFLWLASIQQTKTQVRSI